MKYLTEAGHVHLQGKGAASHRFDLRHTVSWRIHIPQAKRYVRAGMGQGTRNRITQPARRAGNQRHLTGKTKVRVTVQDASNSRCLVLLMG
jgi:hypothetical protein